jgi:hypothetical protein
MGKALIIGCGGVASVAIHKCCQNSDVFEEIMIASRTRQKCDALRDKLSGGKTKISTAQVDADNVPELIRLIESFRPDVVLNLALITRLNASPSTQIWNPSTDIQATKTFHLNIDNYVNDTTMMYYFGVEYGLYKNFEIGFDINENYYSGVPTANGKPLYFNFKYGLPEGELMPAVAAGGMSLGMQKTENDETGAQINGTDYNIFFALVAKTFKPMAQEQIADLLQRTRKVALAGQYERFKTSMRFDGTGKHPEWLGREQIEEQA